MELAIWGEVLMAHAGSGAGGDGHGPNGKPSMARPSSPIDAGVDHR